MEIFSQDKEKVKKYNNIITISYGTNCETSEQFWIIYIDGADIAHYKTKERAKEVLREILNKYKNSYSVVNDNLSYMTIVLIPTVYEMPEE